MTLLTIEGYDWMPSNPANVLTALGYAGGAVGSTSVSSTTAFGQGKSMQYGTTTSPGNSFLWRPLPARNTHTLFVGRRIMIASGHAGFYIGFADSQSGSANAVQLYAFPNDFGGFYITRGDGTTIAQTKSNIWQFDRHFYLEMKYLRHPTAGLFEMRVNTQVVASFPVLNTSNGTPSFGQPYGIDYFGIGPASSFIGGATLYEDDVYCLDDQGAYNNTYLGNVKVPAQLPSGPGSLTNWTIGGTSPAATNWQSALNLALDDTKYNFSSTVGAEDLYSIQAIINAPAVYGVQVHGGFRQDDATQRAVRNVIKSGSVTSEGPDRYINQNYTLYPDLWELDPNTGVGWTGASLNSLQVGPKLTL